MNDETTGLSAEHPAVLAWLDAAQALVDADWHAKGYDHALPPLLVLEEGRRYIRVWSLDDGGNAQRHRYIWAFIDMPSGDVLKPEGYLKPAAHARGNLFDTTGGTGRLTAYGPEYLR